MRGASSARSSCSPWWRLPSAGSTTTGTTRRKRAATSGPRSGAGDGSSKDEGAPDELSAVADAIEGAAAYSARVAARVWSRPLEAAAEELLATPEVWRALDRTLSSPLPEELAGCWSGIASWSGSSTSSSPRVSWNGCSRPRLSSPQSQELVDRVLASPALKQALERVLSGPEVRAALTSQTTGFAQEVMSGARENAAGLNSRPS